MSTVDFCHHFNGILDSPGEPLSNGRIQVQWEQKSMERAGFDILRRAKNSLHGRIGFWSGGKNWWQARELLPVMVPP